MNLSYQNILKTAWQITWRNKILWFFGVFASFISLEAVYEIILSQIAQTRKIESFHLELVNLYNNQINFVNEQLYFFNSLADDYKSYIILILLAVVILFFIWLAFTSQIFIIKSVAKIKDNKKINLNIDLAHSHSKFWSILGVNVIAKLLLYAGFIAFSLPLLYALLNQNQPVIWISNLLFFIIYVIFAIIISFIAAYATNFIILKDSHILESFSQAWKLFSKNITISLEIALVLFILKILSLILILCLTFLFVSPLFFLFMLATASNNLLSLVMTITLGFLIFTFISLFINSIFTTFYLASWTITFLQLTEKSFWGKLISFAKNIKNLLKKFSQKYDLDFKKKELKTETKKITQKLGKEYEQEIKPKAKKQSQIAAKKIKSTYSELEPKLEKEIKKIIAQKTKQKSKKTQSNTSRKTKNNKSKKTANVKTKKNTAPKSSDKNPKNKTSKSPK
jgi:hypothetical protein